MRLVQQKCAMVQGVVTPRNTIAHFISFAKSWSSARTGPSCEVLLATRVHQFHHFVTSLFTTIHNPSSLLILCPTRNFNGARAYACAVSFPTIVISRVFGLNGSASRQDLTLSFTQCSSVRWRMYGSAATKRPCPPRAVNEVCVFGLYAQSACLTTGLSGRLVWDDWLAWHTVWEEQCQRSLLCFQEKAIGDPQTGLGESCVEWANPPSNTCEWHR